MQNLPMDVLRSFVAIAEVKSVTRAGELIGRSQPAVSLQLKRLEAMVDDSLFTRHGKQIALTQNGELLFGYAKRILLLNDEALRQFIKPDLSGSIRFGIPSEFATTLLPKIVGQFALSYPNVTLEVTCDLSKHLLDNKQHIFDLILALQDDPSDPLEDQIKVDDLVWVTSSKHQAHLQPVTPIIAAPEGCIYRNRGTQILSAAEQPWRIVYTIPDLTGIEAAIEEGLGVTVLAKSTVPNNLQIIKPSDKFPELGKIGISLINNNNIGESVTRLMDYVKASLS